jgi:hypothetical protein
MDLRELQCTKSDKIQLASSISADNERLNLQIEFNPAVQNLSTWDMRQGAALCVAKVTSGHYTSHYVLSINPSLDTPHKQKEISCLESPNCAHVWSHQTVLMSGVTKLCSCLESPNCAHVWSHQTNCDLSLKGGGRGCGGLWYQIQVTLMTEQ